MNGPNKYCGWNEARVLPQQFQIMSFLLFYARHIPVDEMCVCVCINGKFFKSTKLDKRMRWSLLYLFFVHNAFIFILYF